MKLSTRNSTRIKLKLKAKFKVQVKVKNRPLRPIGGVEVSLYSLTSTPDGGEW